MVKLTGAGPDAVLIYAREGAVLNQSVDMVRRGGSIVLVGFVPLEEAQRAFDSMYSGENITVLLKP